jgi:hypothetical protein
MALADDHRVEVLLRENAALRQRLRVMQAEQQAFAWEPAPAEVAALRRHVEYLRRRSNILEANQSRHISSASSDEDLELELSVCEGTVQHCLQALREQAAADHAKTRQGSWLMQAERGFW